MLSAALFAALSAALLTLTDPTGDAVGNGTLTAPTATAFRSTEVFDVRSVSVPDAATFGFALEFGLLPPPGAFPRAITELYVHDAGAAARGRPGRTALLPGSGMRLPEGRGWHLAFRLAGDELQVFSSDDPGTSNPTTSNPTTSNPAVPHPASDDPAPDDPVFARPLDGGVHEVTQALGARVARRGNSLIVTTELSTPERFSLYGMTGMYDPFDETGWRALRSEPSPWGFSSPDQRLPVLDVMTDSYAQQQQAIDQGTLPEIRASFAQEGWLLLTGAGVLISLIGLAARFAVRRDPPPATPAPPALEPGVSPQPPLTGPATQGVATPSGVRPRILVVKRPTPSAETETEGVLGSASK